MRKSSIELIGEWLNALLTSASPSSRRGMLGRLGLALGGLASLGVGVPDVDAKRKKKRRKKQGSPQPARPSDWTGKWSTKLSNGVKGTANFTYDGAFSVVTGTYSNSVGSGTLTCEVSESIFDPGEFQCSGDYQQVGGETGIFIITLSDRNHWSGSYSIYGTDYHGSWSGVRK
jgi:hypothetical protein